MTDSPADFSRINELFDVGKMSAARVLIAGCGSGGSQVALQLVMSGIHELSLYDRDVMEVENVIRHACGRRYVGWRKVDALADLLLDRNPALRIDRNDTDIMQVGNFAEAIGRADVVVLATDNEASRFRVNELCVQAGTAMVVGKVFTRGIGGEVFALRPGTGGCLACLEAFLQRSQFRDGVREIDLLSEGDREKIYGMEVREIKDSPGLNVDISFITSFHTRFVLDCIASRLAERPKYLFPIDENYLVWGNRPVHPFKKNFEIQRIKIHPKEGCLVCSGKSST